MKMQKNQPIGFPCGSIALLVGVVNAAIYLIYSTLLGTRQCGQ